MRFAERAHAAKPWVPPWRPAIVPPTAPFLRPEQRPDTAELFFSSSGRLSRTPFIAGEACVLGGLWLYDRWAGGALRLATGWAVLGVLLFSGGCLASRRLHDLGRAGWWAAAVWALFLLAWPAPRGGPGAVGLALLVPVALWLCAMPGQGRPNRFGPPLRR